ncbi:hypothetical protein DFH06DRAFT_1139149 [Mycena polygramma]|nr:hypothetical protein DFH06DRAFT_1139149 [Mycena polygramma]
MPSPSPAIAAVTPPSLRASAVTGRASHSTSARCCDWPRPAIMLGTVSAGIRPQRAAQRYRINPVARARAREIHVRGMRVGRRQGRHGADFTQISCCSLLPASLSAGVPTGFGAYV